VAFREVARIDLETGQMQWSRDMSSYAGGISMTTACGVTSLAGQCGQIGCRTVEMWKVDSLPHRPRTGGGGQPAAADLKGIVHFFDAATGAPAARLSTSGDRVTAAPVVSGDTIVFLDTNGKLFALRGCPPASSRKQTQACRSALVGRPNVGNHAVQYPHGHATRWLPTCSGHA
jgi:hypothetical protein